MACCFKADMRVNSSSTSSSCYRAIEILSLLLRFLPHLELALWNSRTSALLCSTPHISRRGSCFGARAFLRSAPRSPTLVWTNDTRIGLHLHRNNCGRGILGLEVWLLSRDRHLGEFSGVTTASDQRRLRRA